jgi:hypothetical protein
LCFVSGLVTLQPLGKTFALLLFGIAFYSTIGINLFQHHAYENIPGSSDKGNLFGAACVLQAGESHPFENFGTAFVAMYTLASTDNFAEVMWPFYTCECQFVAANSSASDALASFDWRIEDRCQYRQAVALGESLCHWH